MENLTTFIIYIISFVIIALASKQIGVYFNRFKLPLISGFLFTGVIAGPYVLGLIPANSLENLRFIDEIALAVIAFAAGNELYIKELRDRLKSITWITTGLVISTFTLGTLTIVLFGNTIPFMQNMSIPERVRGCNFRRIHPGSALTLFGYCDCQRVAGQGAIHSNSPGGHGDHGCSCYRTLRGEFVHCRRFADEPAL